MQGVAARAEMLSPSGTDSRVRDASLVSTTDCETPGTVSSLPRIAAAADTEDTPGTISKLLPFRTHHSICSWMAP